MFAPSTEVMLTYLNPFDILVAFDRVDLTDLFAQFSSFISLSYL